MQSMQVKAAPGRCLLDFVDLMTRERQRRGDSKWWKHTPALIYVAVELLLCKNITASSA